MSTFLCSLRTDPAPLGYFLECGPSLAGNVGTGSAFALSRDGNQDVDVPMLAADRSRSAGWHWVGFDPYPLRCGFDFWSALFPEFPFADEDEEDGGDDEDVQ